MVIDIHDAMCYVLCRLEIGYGYRRISNAKKGKGL